MGTCGSSRAGCRATTRSTATASRRGGTRTTLNRLTSVEEYPSTPAGYGAKSFQQAYAYDRWGNRTVALGQSSNVPVGQYNFERGDLANTNRLYAPGDPAYTGSNYGQRKMQYDAAGNLVYDAYTGKGGRTYDGENRMTSAVYNQYGDTAFYTYDADGRRVKRKIENEEWWQVYGLGGEQLAEYRAGAATYLASKEYGYRGGELLVMMSSGDDQRLRRFVQNLYYGALHRDPTTQELQEKTNELVVAGAQSQAQLLQTGAYLPVPPVASSPPLRAFAALASATQRRHERYRAKVE